MERHLVLDPTVEQLLKDYDEQKSDLVQDYLVHRQVERGDSLYRLKPVYVLCIANYLRMHVAEEREAIAKSLLKLGVSVEIVAQASGLSQEAVHAL